ncbi:MAG: hypothetical protein BMS9Abin05_1217 [Rhodothermia bacterium]|nr:MAG: hypothetical protein BMS9Abin05_1217 [Rhodothermia bacterium]
MRYLILFGVFFLHLSNFVSAQVQENERMGLLVMAHGGTPEWNQAILDAVAPLENAQPTSVAFGMADPNALQASVNELQSQGVTRIGIVRLFISSESFLHSTEYLFGLRDDPPVAYHDSTTTTRLELAVPVSISRLGLLDAPPIGEILSDRALALSLEPVEEAVLIVGHGPDDDLENEIWIRRMNDLANQVRYAAPFHKVYVNTLREDWTNKRAVVEKELRAFIVSEASEGRTVLIIPFRLYGFGPYSDVFDGLNYRADSLGFLPDERISNWIREQFHRLTVAESISNSALSDSLSN